MLKAINLQAKVHIGSDPASADKFGQSLTSAFAQANPGLRLDVKKITPPDADGNATIRVHIEGEQEPASDFAALTRAGLNKAVASLGAGKVSSKSSKTAASATPHLHDVQEVEDPDDDSGLVLPPKAQAAPAAPSSSPPSSASAPSSTPPSQTAPTAQASQPQTQGTAGSQSRWWAFWKRGKQG